MLDSVIRVNKKYYPQTLLKECKYVIRKNKMENLINNDLNLSYKIPFLSFKLELVIKTIGSFLLIYEK